MKCFSGRFCNRFFFIFFSSYLCFVLVSRFQILTARTSAYNRKYNVYIYIHTCVCLWISMQLGIVDIDVDRC